MTERHRPRRALAAVTACLAVTVGIGPIGNATAQTGSDCPTVIDADGLASQAQLREWNARTAQTGLRTTGSAAHQDVVDWLEEEMLAIPGVSTRSLGYQIKRWQPTPRADNGRGRSLAKAGGLKVTEAGGEAQQVPVVGAVPYALPTGKRGQAGDLVYLPPDLEISPATASGKIVIRDFPDAGVPYAGLFALSYFLTPDLLGEAANDYDHGGFADGPLHADLVAAGRAGAAGVVVAFDFPREQVLGYYEPHRGMHYRMPAVGVGVEEAERLKRIAAEGGSARVAVLAETDRATTRSLIATLPGTSTERIVFGTNTDGNTWVQENGHAGMLALAHYFADLPMQCRPRTFEFVFATGHLHFSAEGTMDYARMLDEEYDSGTVAFAFAIEHLGTREVLPVARADGPGRELRYSGLGEAHGWFAGDSPALAAAAIEATVRRGLDRTAVLRGADVPQPGRVPPHCSFGGIGGTYHGHLIPTMAMISGPWSLWAPTFGEQAIDFDRMRSQVLAAGDTVLALDDVAREVIAGPTLAYRQARAAGAPTCDHERQPEEAPGPGE